jgi:hypothetical protein
MEKVNLHVHTPQTGINLRAFPALLQDRREVLTATSTRVTRTLGRGSDLAIFSLAFGRADPAGGYAGYFLGNVYVTGTLTQNMQRSVVAFPDGSQHALYGMASPELWFEDFGTAKLVRGRALVKLDADFVKVIKRGDYKVFLTPEADCRGLYARRRAASFQVGELMGGKSSIAFSYRIVGRARTSRDTDASPR